jgi:cytochrome c oxidase subunit 4
MSTQSHETAHEHEHEHYIVPLKNYVINAFALAFLMALTVVASYINLGPFNAAVAIGIAVTKGALIVLFFMNTWYNTRLTWIFVSLSFFWLLILFGMFLPDYFARDFQLQPDAWASVPSQQVILQHDLPMDRQVVEGGAAHGSGH